MIASTHLRHAALGLALSALAAGAVAQQPPSGGPGGGRPMGPPPEAYTACQGKTEGASVTITTPDGKQMAATCVKGLDGRLAARPNDMPKGPPPGRSS